MIHIFFFCIAWCFGAEQANNREYECMFLKAFNRQLNDNDKVRSILMLICLNDDHLQPQKARFIYKADKTLNSNFTLDIDPKYACFISCAIKPARTGFYWLANNADNYKQPYLLDVTWDEKGLTLEHVSKVEHMSPYPREDLFFMGTTLCLCCATRRANGRHALQIFKISLPLDDESQPARIASDEQQHYNPRELAKKALAESLN
jgi:hypothetical protein